MKGRVSALQREVLASSSVAVGRKTTRRFVADADGEPFGIDLRAEMLGLGIDHRGCQRLEALGIDGRFVCELSARLLIGAAKLTLSQGGSRWEPGGPDARLLLAMTDGGELADIAAVSTAHPDQVALRTGDGWCLGEDVIRQAEADAWGAERRVTVKLVADPIEWLRCKGRAVWVADWGAALPRLRGLGERVTLECDAGAGARIKALLAVGGLPRVKERAPVARVMMGEAA